jgi:hypothetical protein
VKEGGVPVFYSWDYLRAAGHLSRSKRGDTQTGAQLTWRKPTESANLPADWLEAQRKYRHGDGSDAVIDPNEYGVQNDADEFADKAQRAANGEDGFKGNLRLAIKRAQETGQPQAVDIFLPGSGPLYGARGLVLGLYGIRVRGVVIVKDGKYTIVGRAIVEDQGKFNYGYDGQRNRTWMGKAALGLTRYLPDPTTDEHKVVAAPGHEYSIRANRDADIQIWGVVR